MRFRLRTLVIATAVGPPLLAIIYWTATWFVANQIAIGIAALLGLAAAWVIGPIVWYRELMRFVCGPDCFRPMPRKTRRRIRYRLQRYAGDST
jgi:hypothetical protein